MESYLTQQILTALGEGDFKKVVAYGLIFFVIWIEVRGMKKELKNINVTVNHAFKEGEKRFDEIETKQSKFDNRLTQLENLTLNIQPEPKVLELNN